MINTRFDFVFSYWIFVWYLLYIFKVIDYNPFVALIIAIINNIIAFSLMIYYQNDALYLFLFVFINSIIKIIPLLTLYNAHSFNMHKCVKDLIDGLKSFACLFAIYAVWMYINNRSFITYIYLQSESIKNNKPFTPIIYYAVKLLRNK
jgi:hypothetical protein